MTEEDAKKWLPTEWLDEVVPAMEGSPDAYIHREGDGWILRLPDGNESQDDENWRMKVEPGQVVSFCWTEHFGTFELKVNDDRSWSVDRPIPERATHFWFPFDTDTMAGSVEELVKGNDFTGPTEPGEHSIGAYFWSDEVHFRFEVDGDNGRMVQCAGAN